MIRAKRCCVITGVRIVNASLTLIVTWKYGNAQQDPALSDGRRTGQAYSALHKYQDNLKSTCSRRFHRQDWLSSSSSTAIRSRGKGAGEISDATLHRLSSYQGIVDDRLTICSSLRQVQGTPTMRHGWLHGRDFPLDRQLKATKRPRMCYT